jgi:hypothetical protein
MRLGMRRSGRPKNLFSRLGVHNQGALIHIALDKKEDVARRELAMEALGYRAVEENIYQALVELVEAEPMLRKVACETLTRISEANLSREKLEGEKRFRRDLRQLHISSADDLPRIVQSNSETTERRLRACSVILDLALQKAIPWRLQKAPINEKDAISEAGSVANNLTVRKVVPALLHAISDKNEHLIWIAANSLGAIGSRVATQRLVELVHNIDREPVRQAGIYALGFLQDSRAESTGELPGRGTVAELARSKLNDLTRVELLDSARQIRRRT